MPRIMGILNITPDSFSDGGLYNDRNSALRRAIDLINQGADLLDIGAESTRPDAIALSAAEEWARLQPVLHDLYKAQIHHKVEISLDSYHVETMHSTHDAFGEGFISIYNDVNPWLDFDLKMDFLKHTKAKMCLAHNRRDFFAGNPPIYPTGIWEDIEAYFTQILEAAHQKGFHATRFILDPAIGFAKNVSDNIEILTDLKRLKFFGLPVLLAASRKRFIEGIMQDFTPPDKRIGGSLAAIAAGLSADIDIYRVHDVYDTRQFIDVCGAIGV